MYSVRFLGIPGASLVFFCLISFSLVMYRDFWGRKGDVSLLTCKVLIFALKEEKKP